MAKNIPIPIADLDIRFIDPLPTVTQEEPTCIFRWRDDVLEQEWRIIERGAFQTIRGTKWIAVPTVSP